MTLERLKELEGEMHKCFRCNLCKMVPLPVVRHPDYFDICPANREYVFHSYSGSGKQIMALALTEGRIEADQKLSEIAYACTTCGSCDVSCKFNMDAERQKVNMALREHMVDEKLENIHHRETIENLKTHGHPDGNLPMSPGEWARDLGVKKIPEEKAEVLLFAGCMNRSDASTVKVLKKFVQILQHAKVDFGILGDDEPSCGLHAYWTGYRDVFKKIAAGSISRFNQSNVGKIVTVSGSCMGTFRSKYPEYVDASFPEVFHATEFLWDLIKEKKLLLPKKVDRKVTYHDPCYLGKQSEPPVKWNGTSLFTHGCITYNRPTKPVNMGTKGVFDAPRKILNTVNGLDFREMYRIREYSFCCGGGGGVPKAYPEMAYSAALHRFEEAKDVGADYLVTTCHECRIHLSDSGKKIEQNKALPVIDIIDIVHEAADI